MTQAQSRPLLKVTIDQQSSGQLPPSETNSPCPNNCFQDGMLKNQKVVFLNTAWILAASSEVFRESNRYPGNEASVMYE